MKLQSDEVSSHRDGSVRFAVLSAQVPNMAANESRVINFYTGAKTAVTAPSLSASGWNMVVEAKVYDANNVATTYVADAQSKLQQQITQGSGRRLNGPVASEYTVVVPLKNASTGAEHPHLTARLHTRLYEGGARIRTDVVMENNWTFKAGPGNITYEMAIKQNGTTVYSQPKFTHYHHARWHKVVWAGAEPSANVRHHIPYFIDSKATWNYDVNLYNSSNRENVLAKEASSLASAKTAPMQAAFLQPYFPNTGGRDDIGPLPRWTVLYLLTQDKRAKASMLANADAGAGVPVHYRNENNDQPIDVASYPNLTLVSGTSSPAVPKGSGTTIWEPDTAHQASLAYIPYLVTGDAFYLDEVMFWASWNVASGNPDTGYRNGSSGLMRTQQIRGQAWGLRSIAEAAYALPDQHTLKSYFNNVLTNNMTWYGDTYKAGNTAVSSLGLIESLYDDGRTSPWQNDFVTIIFSWLSENQQPRASEMLNWNSKFTVGRFNAESAGFCTAKAPGYWWNDRDTGNNFIATWNALFARNYASQVGKSCTGMAIDEGAYPTCSNCYAANARAMLGAASNAGVANAKSAYTRWKTFTPALDQAFVADPTWAIIPR